MPKKLGESLAIAVDGRLSGAESPGFPESHITILKNVFSRPGSSLNNIASMSEIGWNSAKRALALLEKREYLQRVILDGKRGYVPSGRVSAMYAPLLVAVANKRINSLLRTVVDFPGLSVEEVLSVPNCGRSTIKICASLGIISIVEDGRHRRLYPSRAIRDVNDDMAVRNTSLARSVVEKLLMDGYGALMETTPGGILRVRLETSPPVHLEISVSIPYAPKK